MGTRKAYLGEEGYHIALRTGEASTQKSKLTPSDPLGIGTNPLQRRGIVFVPYSLGIKVTFE